MANMGDKSQKTTKVIKGQKMANHGGAGRRFDLVSVLIWFEF